MTSDPVATQRLSRPPATTVSHGVSQTVRPYKAQEASLAPKEPLFNTSFEAAQRRQRPEPKVANSVSQADFSPWTGYHSEDVLSELMIKQGFYDKSQFSHEANTTWPSLWSSLKHKSGLQILSSLLVNVLDRKQTQGMVGITSTFKPPPRVTLTDTKREAWLRDLANPTIPLRRLSRTIPHGIRNKVLLDQCLGKDVPIARAIWLAKCVGANEIRAFKRKGASGVFAVGGETKWIREWTINVEQFLAMIIEDSKNIEWNTKLDYG
ncbi:MAG: hypothetical protein Q9214_001749, partial [Letrouitia sp. 1 TL-2023]